MRIPDVQIHGTRDGTAVSTPVWFESDGRRLFALNDLHSGKVRRIRPDGELRGDSVPAHARC